MAIVASTQDLRGVSAGSHKSDWPNLAVSHLCFCAQAPGGDIDMYHPLSCELLPRTWYVRMCRNSHCAARLVSYV